jgi:uroporphyrinogen decarboxylase
MTEHRTEKKLIGALAGKAYDKPPVWLMRQAGRYLPEYRALRSEAGGFLELCLNPAAAAEVTLQPVRRFGMDAAILFSDILIVPFGLGQPLEFKQGDGPTLLPLETAADLKRLNHAGLPARVAPIGETVRRVCADLPGDSALIGFAGSPWTVATYMVEGGASREFARIKRWIYRDPSGFDALIEQLIEATVDYLSLQIDAGAEVIQLFESWAGVLASQAFDRWVVKPNARIIQRLNALFPTIPVILFPRGAGLNYQSVIEGVTAAGIGLDTTVPLEWAINLDSSHTIQGNLDPHVLLIGGPILEIEVRRICDAIGKRPFIFNLGHGVLPDTPPEHVAKLVGLIRA